MLAGTETEARVRDALATLSDSKSAAVMLRDGYDLPPQAVGVALRRSNELAAELTAAGRLALVAAYDERPAPDLLGHSGRTTVDLTSLSRLAEGTLDAPRAAPLRRHLGNCPACEEVVEALARGRRLAAALPIIAMDDDAREGLIERVAQRAAAVLPSHETVLRVVDQDHDPGPAVSPVVAVIMLVLAVAIGIALGAISRAGSHTPGPLANSAPPTQPPESALFSPPASAKPPHHRSHSPTPSMSATATATTISSPTDLPSDTPTSTPISELHPTVGLSPPGGRQGTHITVIGTGWPAGSRVFVSYAGHPQSSAQVDSQGSFTASVVANSVLPGNRRVTVTDGTLTVTATFNQHL
jgi:hypothetical protein